MKNYTTYLVVDTGIDVVYSSLVTVETCDVLLPLETIEIFIYSARGV
jgi:hypothetical protein